MEAKIIAAANKSGNLIIKGKNHQEMRNFIDKHAGLLLNRNNKENLTQSILTEKLPDYRIISPDEFTKDRSFEVICTNKDDINIIPFNEDGFIDENGDFINRRVAFKRAKKTGQLNDSAQNKYIAWSARYTLNSEMIDY